MSTKSLIFGDKVLLVIVLLLTLFSFFPVFSSSSYLSYVIDGSSPIYYLVKTPYCNTIWFYTHVIYQTSSI